MSLSRCWYITSVVRASIGWKEMVARPALVPEYGPTGLLTLRTSSYALLSQRAASLTASLSVTIGRLTAPCTLLARGPSNWFELLSVAAAYPPNCARSGLRVVSVIAPDGADS